MSSLSCPWPVLSSLPSAVAFRVGKLQENKEKFRSRHAQDVGCTTTAILARETLRSPVTIPLAFGASVHHLSAIKTYRRLIPRQGKSLLPPTPARPGDFRSPGPSTNLADWMRPRSLPRPFGNHSTKGHIVAPYGTDDRLFRHGFGPRFDLGNLAYCETALASSRTARTAFSKSGVWPDFA